MQYPHSHVSPGSNEDNQGVVENRFHHVFDVPSSAVAITSIHDDDVLMVSASHYDAVDEHNTW